MNNMKIAYEILPKYKMLYEDHKKKYFSDAGFDLRCAEIVEKNVSTKGSLRTGKIVVATGVNFQIPVGYVGLVRDRSSLASEGLIIAGGVIDTGYYDPEYGIRVILYDIYSPFDKFNPAIGSRIAQIIFVPCVLNLVEEKIEAGERANNGFGSTGLS